MTDDHAWGPNEEAIADRLQRERPQAGHGLRRRVQVVIRRAVHERHLRRRAAVLVGSGSAVLAIAGWLAVSAPQ
jgi:hypothetical protein